MRRRIHYLSADFEVWPDRRIWFWRLLEPYRGGTIGAAATEAEAIHEACTSIEERCSQPRAHDATERIASDPRAILRLCRSNSIGASIWEALLMNFERYLAGIRDADTCSASNQ